MTVKRRTWTSTTGRKQEAWMVDFSIGPDPESRVRRSGFTTRREAEEWERQERLRLEEEARFAKLPAEERRRLAAASMTIADLAKSWLSACKDGTETGVPVEPTTYAGYEGSVRLHILPRVGTTLVAGVDGPMLTALQARLLREVSRSKTKRVMQHVRQMLNHAVRLGLMAASPGTAVRLKADSRATRRPRMPSDDEFKALLHAIDRLRAQAVAEAERCRRERPNDDKAGLMYEGVARSWVCFSLLLRTLAATGLRVSELLALRWGDLTFGEKASFVVE